MKGFSRDVPTTLFNPPSAETAPGLFPLLVLSISG
jgi:hypothetical protein